MVKTKMMETVENADYMQVKTPVDEKDEIPAVKRNNSTKKMKVISCSIPAA